MIMKELYAQLGISSAVYDFGKTVEDSLKERFEKFDKTAEYNQMKVIHAMQKNRVSEACFGASSGYGYNDLGRETLEQVYADTFHTEACLVRPQITCGTHALAIALFGNLRPGDELLSPVGKPYDTLEEVIGIRPSNRLSCRNMASTTVRWIFSRMVPLTMKTSEKQSMKKQNW